MMEIDLTTKCRACLRDEERMHLIFSEFASGMTLSEIIATTIKSENLIMEENDGLSPYLCEICTSVLIDFYNFKEVFQENHNRVKQLIEECESIEEKDLVYFSPEGIEVTNNNSIIKEADGIVIKTEDDTKNSFLLVEDDNTIEINSLLQETNLVTEVVDNNIKEVIEIKYSCTECNQDFTNICNYKEHLATHTYIVVPEQFNNVAVEDNDQIKQEFEDQIFRCALCATQYSSAEDLKVHMRQHKKYVCDHCGAAFSKKPYLEDHCQSHSLEKRFVCKYCGKAFNRRTVLAKHIRIHTHPRECMCDLCGNTFNDEGTLKTHVKLIHIKERKFKCLQCDMSFPLKATLIKHHIRHDKNRERSYKCDQCNMAYRDKSSLKRHYSKHTGTEKKFTCSSCDKDYSTSNNLRRHTAKHHLLAYNSEEPTCSV